MKFAYIDESGSDGEGDVFTMAGLLVDAYRLRRYTTEFDTKLRNFRLLHPDAPQDFKTKKFINGSGGWRQVDANDRKQFLTDCVDLVVECGKVYAYGMSFTAFSNALSGAEDLPQHQNNYWLACSMLVASLIQKKNQKETNNKGLTVLIFDDNKMHMPKLSDGIYLANPWYDGLYALPRTVRGNTIWAVKANDRFDHIINTAFAIKSEHSSLVQIADMLSYIYRRHLELYNDNEAYPGEKDFYSSLVTSLEPKRIKLGRTPPQAPSVVFYNAAKHPNWNI